MTGDAGVSNALRQSAHRTSEHRWQNNACFRMWDRRTQESRGRGTGSSRGGWEASEAMLLEGTPLVVEGEGCSRSASPRSTLAMGRAGTDAKTGRSIGRMAEVAHIRTESWDPAPGCAGERC